MSTSPNIESKFQIQLGDIIEIESPSDIELNDKQFFISYASSQLIKLSGETGEYLKGNINRVTKSVVEKYVNELPEARLMFSMNYYNSSQNK